MTLCHLAEEAPGLSARREAAERLAAVADERLAVREQEVLEGDLVREPRVRLTEPSLRLLRSVHEPVGHEDERAIRLCADGDRGLLRIEDDGSGFNPATLQCKGLGLRIMRYRAQMMAGSLRIESARARGTVVSCWFPCQGLAPHLSGAAPHS